MNLIPPIIYAALFVTLYLLARRGGPPWRRIDTAVLLWGLSYAGTYHAFNYVASYVFWSQSFAWIWFSWFLTMAVAIGPPGIITAALIGASFKSRRAALVILAATALAVCVAVPAPTWVNFTSAALWLLIIGYTFFKFRPRPDPDPVPAAPAATT